MSKKKNNPSAPVEDESTVVEMVDDEGNVYLYTEEVIIPVDNKRFAILVELLEDEPEDDYEPEVIIAKIILDDEGEDLYVEPTDEEFEKVQAAYDRLFDEEEAVDEAK